MKWTSKENQSIYFEKQSVNTWHEYRGTTLFARFKEIRKYFDNGVVVILQREDGKFLRLTKEASYWGIKENRIKILVNKGGWTNSGSNSGSKFGKCGFRLF